MRQIAEMSGIIEQKETGKEHQIGQPMPEGEFKLSKEVYKKLLQECKQGDVTYIRLKSNKVTS